MGYYTGYNLTAIDTKTEFPLTEEMEARVCARLIAISNDAIDEGNTFGECLNDVLKWYDHEKDMIELSKEFPDIMFMLEGEGEERDDNWRLYVHNGELEWVRAMLVWDAPVTQKFQRMDW